MMLDEIDKMGRGIQGDPSAAMLEVLDPEQNSTFRDNYLAVPLRSVARLLHRHPANMLDTVPGPLLDRMEIISLPGYTEDEEARNRAPLSGPPPARGQWADVRAGRNRAGRAETDH